MPRTVHVLLGSNAGQAFVRGLTGASESGVFTTSDCLSCGPLEPMADVPVWTDSSPYVAAAELKKAQDVLGGLPKAVPLTPRCMFVESDQSAYERLREVARSMAPMDVVTYRGESKSHVDAAVNFGRAGQKPFVLPLSIQRGGPDTG
jgi:hypothetical protein